MSHPNSTSPLAAFLIGGALGLAIGRLWGSDAGRDVVSKFRQRMGRVEQPRLDEALEESFPASDPPAWTPATTRPGEQT